MSVVGRCIICYSGIVSTNAVALTKCGHTFHDTCVSPWIATGKACPTCRAKTLATNILKLYFDTLDPNDTFYEATQADQSSRIAELNSIVEQHVLEKEELSKKNTELNANVKDLKSKVQKLQTKAGRMNTLELTIKQLEDKLQDQTHLKKMLEQAEQKLKASDFYRLIKACELGDNAWKEYLGKNGDLIPNGFQNLFSQQVQQLKEKYNLQNSRLLTVTKELDEEKKKRDLNKKLIVELQKQLKDAQEKLNQRNDHLSPRRALKDIIDYSPEKNNSFGFNFSDNSGLEIPNAKDLLDSAFNGNRIRKPISKATQKPKRLNFDSPAKKKKRSDSPLPKCFSCLDSDDESVPSISPYKPLSKKVHKALKKKPYNFFDSDDESKVESPKPLFKKVTKSFSTNLIDKHPSLASNSSSLNLRKRKAVKKTVTDYYQKPNLDNSVIVLN